ncbi:TonB-dependent receptor [bacterium]|nr:TonB-dependent receptor [bacterium]
MKSNKIVLLLLLLTSVQAIAQDSLRGVVVDASRERQTPLPGAFVHWHDTLSGIYTDAEGYFKIPVSETSKLLVVNFITYESDTTVITNTDSVYLIKLKTAGDLEPVNVFSRFLTYGLSGIEPRTTINLDEREFQKAACCNLSESFQNAPAIDVSFGDAITGTRQIKMLGLDGFYTLISREYMPAVRTLNSYYGMSFIPASWVESIQITKGAGSIVNGYESIAGQINIEMKKPFGKEKIILDQFVAQSGRAETDLMYQFNINQKVASSIFARVGLFRTMQDRNDDGFLDNPFGRQVAVMNRWQFYSDKNYEGQINASYTNDEKTSGQVDYLQNKEANDYGIELKNEQFDVWGKLGKTFPEYSYRSLGSQFRVNHSRLDGRYGPESNSTQYVGRASSLYANVMYETIINNTFHKIKTGVSMLADQMDETYIDTSFSRTEVVPGIFAEYTYQPKEQLSFVVGARTDYNSIYGITFTPRFHSKWRFNEDNTSLRTSAGIGRRTANIFSQYQQFFVSNRTFEIQSSNDFGAYGLEQEVAVNAGLSFEHKFKISYFPATLFLDYFHTSFLNEVVFDREIPGEVHFYNQKNGTRSNSMQAQLDIQPFRRTEIRLAYRMFDVTTLYNHSLGKEMQTRMSKAFIARNRAFINITQGSRKGWSANTTLQWYGPQRIPGYNEEVNGNTTVNRLKMSPDFFLWNLQVSKTFKFPIEVYLGMENIMNYKQESPIQFANDIGNDEFDAGLVWGPIFGRMVYGGFRYRLKYKEKEEK